MTRTRNPFKYRCYLRRNGKKCYNTGCLFTGSFFSQAHLNIKTIMTLLCEWVKGVSNAGACAELNLTPSMVTKWYKKFSLLIYNFYYSSDSEVQIGGEGCIVELDETLLVKRKYSRGRIHLDHVWHVGGVVRAHCLRYLLKRLNLGIVEH